MGLFERKDSPFWWAYVEAPTSGGRGRYVSTRVPIGDTPADRAQNRQVAEQFYQQLLRDQAEDRFTRVRVPLPRNRKGLWCYLYVVSNGEAVKIGRTFDVAKRLEALQSASDRPLTVLTVTVGHTSTEARVHQRFRRFRLRGEWYRLVPQVQAFVAALQRGEHVEQALVVPRTWRRE